MTRRYLLVAPSQVSVYIFRIDSYSSFKNGSHQALDLKTSSYTIYQIQLIVVYKRQIEYCQQSFSISDQPGVTKARKKCI